MGLIVAALALGWSRQLPAGNPNDWGVAPVGSELLVLSPGRLTAFAATNGRRLWERNSPFTAGTVPHRERSVVAFMNGRQIVLIGGRVPNPGSETKSFIVSLDARTGRLAWKREVPGMLWHLRREGSALVGDTQRGQNGRNAWFQMVVLDASSGVVRAALSPTDETGNRATLGKVCPGIVDKVLAFGPRVMRNGISLLPLLAYAINPSNQVIGDSVYVWAQQDDFPLDLGMDSAKTGLQRFSIGEGGKVDFSSDLWHERGIGRHYHSISCTYLGPVMGEYRGGILAALNRKIVGNGMAKFSATLVTLPKQGGFAVTPLDYSARYSYLAFGGKTDRGDLVLLGRKGSDELKDIAILMTGTGPKEQDFPRAERGFNDWTFAGVCAAGSVYYAQTEDSPNAGPASLRRQIVRVVPFKR